MDLGALSHPLNHRPGGRPWAQSPALPQNAPPPSQPAGSSSALDCSHTDFQSPVPSRPRQRCLHTDTPVLPGELLGGALTAGQGVCQPPHWRARAPWQWTSDAQAHTTPGKVEKTSFQKPALFSSALSVFFQPRHAPSPTRDQNFHSLRTTGTESSPLNHQRSSCSFLWRFYQDPVISCECCNTYLG